MHETATLLSPPENFAVLQLPGRKFPGIVFQGDSLHILVKSVKLMSDLLSARNYEELADEITNTKQKLAIVLDHYESICAKHGIELPY